MRCPDCKRFMRLVNKGRRNECYVCTSCTRPGALTQSHLAYAEQHPNCRAFTPPDDEKDCV